MANKGHLADMCGRGGGRGIYYDEFPVLFRPSEDAMQLNLCVHDVELSLPLPKFLGHALYHGFGDVPEFNGDNDNRDKQPWILLKRTHNNSCRPGNIIC